MANLTSSQIKDSYQSVLTTSETTSDPTTGTLQNGKGTAITTLTVSGTVNATTLGGTLSTASQPNVTSVGTLSSATISGDLTVDTSTLKVDSANNRVGIGTSSPSSGRLQVKGSGSTSGTNAIFVDNSVGAATFAIRDNGDAFLSGNVGIGTGSITGKFQVKAATNQNLYIGGAASLANSVVIGALNDATNANVPLEIRYATNIAFYDSNVERMRIDSSGVLELTQGQIKFPATQVASSDANTLDDYEEGTWTIGVSFGGASAGVTTSANTGTYTKIGRQVTVNGLIQLTSKGSSTGDAKITGLPFTIANTNSNYSPVSLRFDDITFANQFQGYGEINSTTIQLEEITILGAKTDLTNADFADSSDILVSLTYFV
jgi:hypothetical protein